MGFRPSLSSTRWVLAGVLGVLSAIAIVATTGRSEDEDSFIRRVSTDIREPGLMFGSAGLGGLMILRSASVFLPKPWRVYIDRLEFTFVTMLWILWTSATMAFSASAISKTICRGRNGESAPTCSVLALDLVLLHTLSMACFAYLVVVLSTALSPGYRVSHSAMVSDTDMLDTDSEGGDVFIMWELAMGDSSTQGNKNFGADRQQVPAVPVGYGSAVERAAEPVLETNAASTARSSNSETHTTGSPCRTGDRFARSRIALYSPLMVASSIMIALFCVLSARTPPGLTNGLLLFLAISSFSLGSFFLFRQRRQSLQDGKALDTYDQIRRYRAIELGCILALFVLWPAAATVFTLRPSPSTLPCTTPSNPTLPDIDPPSKEVLKDWTSTCNLSLLTLSLAWFCAWLALARSVNLIFPMPESSRRDGPSVPTTGSTRLPTSSAEGQPLLGGLKPSAGQGQPEIVRPQVKYGRLVAGEAFELGDEDD